jgi:general secretion pathway protein M
MSSLMEKLRELLSQIDGLKTYYARLSERERYIVLGSGAAGLLFVMLIIYSAFAATTASINSRIEKSRTFLKKMEDLRTSYVQTERQVRQLEQMVRRTAPDFQLASHLEKLAQRNSVAIESLKERPSPPSNDLYKETQVSVSVKQITLRNLINFLFDIENSNELLRITSLQIKPNFQDPTQLNTNFVVSTFQAVK